MIDGRIRMYFIPVVSEKCTTCKHLVDESVSPVCVASCPTKALKYSRVESLIEIISEKKPISILRLVSE